MDQPNRSWTITNDGSGWLTLPADMWATPCLADHQRFDLVVGAADGTMVLRPCPHTEDSFRADGPGHPADPEWRDGSVCGLTKWVCAGCGAPTIVEHVDRFPDRWIQLIRQDGALNWLEEAVVCSTDCIARFAAAGAPFVPSHLPGFAPAAPASTGDERVWIALDPAVADHIVDAWRGDGTTAIAEDAGDALYTAIVEARGGSTAE